MKLDFSDKRVLVTGGTRGIGRGIVESFLECGARVAINGSSADSVAAAISAIGSSDRLVAAPGDIGAVAGCRAAVDAALNTMGGLDVLVNNAGRVTRSLIEDIQEDDWDNVLNANLKGTLFVTKFAVPALRQSKGSVVNISSILGLVGLRGLAAYCASKGGVVNLTRCLALELAPEIRVNAVCPGGVDTDMLRDSATRLGGNVEAGYELLSRECPQNRIAHAREIAGPVLYLASDLASFVTGSIHVVDGGETTD